MIITETTTYHHDNHNNLNHNNHIKKFQDDIQIISSAQDGLLWLWKLPDSSDLNVLMIRIITAPQLHWVAERDKELRPACPCVSGSCVLQQGEQSVITGKGGFQQGSSLRTWGFLKS